MVLKYRAKCGHTVDQKFKIGDTLKPSYDIIMETDVPLPGEDTPVKRPEFCDPKCLHRRKREIMHLLPGHCKIPNEWDDGEVHTVKAYRCKFAVVEGDEKAKRNK